MQAQTKDGEDWGEWRADGNQTVIHGEAIDRKKGETKPTAYKIINRVSLLNWLLMKSGGLRSWSCRGRANPYAATARKASKNYGGSTANHIIPKKTGFLCNEFSGRGCSIPKTSFYGSRRNAPSITIDPTLEYTRKSQQTRSSVAFPTAC